MEIPYRPLGLIIEAIESMGLEVTHAYEDLVFVSHNAFLLRMGSKGEMVHMYFNEESEPDKRPLLHEQLSSLGAERGLKILWSGTYTMEQRDDEHVDIHFAEDVSDRAQI